MTDLIIADVRNFIDRQSDKKSLRVRVAKQLVKAMRKNERLLEALNEADKQLDFGNVAYAKDAIKKALRKGAQND